jgi:hypothetical protein
VLVIEDSADAREMLRMMRELAGHVVYAPDGVRGLELLNAVDPDQLARLLSGASPPVLVDRLRRAKGAWPDQFPLGASPQGDAPVEKHTLLGVTKFLNHLVQAGLPLVGGVSLNGHVDQRTSTAPFAMYPIGHAKAT